MNLAKFKISVSRVYEWFNNIKNRLGLILSVLLLLIALFIGAEYRERVLRERFHYQIGNMAWALSMASTYTKAPGLYSASEFQQIMNKPDEYIFKKDADPKSATSSMRTDIGYPLILRWILKDNIKGVDQIARHIAHGQLIVDLFVIIVLFFAGLRLLNVTCGVLVAFLYALFKIPMVQMSFVEYYYWPVPLSALCLLGLTFIFQDRKDKSKVSFPTMLIFFGYGLLIGFATYIRLLFFNLPFIILPLLILHEYFTKKEASWLSWRKRIFPALKNSLISFIAILLGLMIFVLPICVYNKYHHGKFALSDRQFWHLPLQGIGLYKNSWGIKDSGDVSINEWAMERGAPSYMGQPPDVIEKAEAWHKKKYIELVKEDPKFFINNFINNFSKGLTVNEADFQFYGLFAAGSKAYRWFVHIFPWMVLSSITIMYLLLKNRAWMFLAAITQGLYFLLIIVTWFMNHIDFISAHIPIFVFLLAISVSVHIKIVLTFLESILRCWLSGNFTRKRFYEEFRRLIASPPDGIKEFAL